MSDKERNLRGASPRPEEKDFWYSILTMFPFLFLPLVALSGLILSWIMPILTGVQRR